MELIISTIAICVSVFTLLIVLNVIQVQKFKKDKFEDFRDPVTGLLTGKRRGN
jgi:hypothetical protein